MSTENETFYDNEIAPRLTELARACEDRGMSFIASVEYAPSETGSTILLSADSSFQSRLMDLATRCNGNVDSLIFALMKYAREHGHSSMCLKQLGVPSVPEGETHL